MGGKLPDEIVKEILSPVLKVSDDDFRDASHTSPFIRDSESSSALLLVCKSWLRVATPLLYGVIILRSKAQAQALERTLRRNKLLGTFARKLRVEGGFGQAMDRIIQLSPNITDLWLTLNLWSSDSVSGLCRGLPKMDPCCVFLSRIDWGTSDNAPIRQLVQALVTCIKAWKNMETLSLPFSSFILEDMKIGSRALKICNALNEAPNLRTLILPYPQFSLEALQAVTKNPTLQRVRVFSWPCDTLEEACKMKKRIREFELSLEEDDALLRDLVVFDDPMSGLAGDRTIPLPVLDPSFVALRSTPQVIKEKIFDHIIYYCLIKEPCEATRRSKRHFDDRPDVEERNTIARVNILSVSKLFRQLARRYLYRCLIIKSAEQLKMLSAHIKEDPSLGASIRTVLVDHRVRSAHIDEFPESGPFAKFFLHLSHIRTLSSRKALFSRLISYLPPVLTMRGLEVLANVAGPSLVTLGGVGFEGFGESGTSAPAAPLYAFTSLRSLEWSGSVNLTFEPDEVPSDALANLESLSFASTNTSFLALLNCMGLPALREVTFPDWNPDKMAGADEFLAVHGAKLTTLRVHIMKPCLFTRCPVLSVLYFSGYDIRCFEPHANLTKIIMTRDDDMSGGYPLLGTCFEELKKVNFSALYPALQELQVYICGWPTTEHEVSNGLASRWVKWSEHLATLTIKLTDRNGRHWRPRLK